MHKVDHGFTQRRDFEDFRNPVVHLIGIIEAVLSCYDPPTWLYFQLAATLTGMLFGEI